MHTFIKYVNYQIVQADSQTGSLIEILYRRNFLSLNGFKIECVKNVS